MVGLSSSCDGLGSSWSVLVAHKSVLVAHDYNPAIGGQEQWMVIGLLGIE